MGKMDRRDDDERSGLASFGMRALGSAKRPCKVVAWPGRADLRVGLWVVRDEEMASARAKAQQFVTDELRLDALKLSLDESTYREELDRQTLLYALRHPEAHDEAFFADADELREVLDADTRQCLMQLYNDFVDERSPIRKATDDDQVRRLVAAVGKEQSESSLLSYYDRGSLARIAIAQAAELIRLTRESFSSTGPSPSRDATPSAPTGGE